MYSACCSDLRAHEPVRQSGQQEPRAYCPNIDTVLETLRVSRFHTGTGMIIYKARFQNFDPQHDTTAEFFKGTSS